MTVEIEHLIICLQEITHGPPLLSLFGVDDFWREIEVSGFFTCGEGVEILRHWTWTGILCKIHVSFKRRQT